MIPTFKPGEVFYRFAGDSTKMRVERYTVCLAEGHVTTLEDKSGRKWPIRNVSLPLEFATTQEGAVDLEIARLKEEVEALQATMKRSFDLIAGYEMFKTVALRKTPTTHVKEEATQDELVASIKAIEEIK